MATWDNMTGEVVILGVWRQRSLEDAGLAGEHLTFPTPLLRGLTSLMSYKVPGGFLRRRVAFSFPYVHMSRALILSHTTGTAQLVPRLGLNWQVQYESTMNWNAQPTISKARESTDCQSIAPAGLTCIPRSAAPVARGSLSGNKTVCGSSPAGHQQSPAANICTHENAAGILRRLVMIVQGCLRAPPSCILQSRSGRRRELAGENSSCCCCCYCCLLAPAPLTEIGVAVGSWVETAQRQLAQQTGEVDRHGASDKACSEVPASLPACLHSRNSADPALPLLLCNVASAHRVAAARRKQTRA
ncbi:hypothetical protein BJ170DRAFT_717889 [Xylariales sp. AK1849]|nr:hypothetical protein BJ170DRAFT_717889 [Xylariales sp. AK1849]